MCLLLRILLKVMSCQLSRLVYFSGELMTRFILRTTKEASPLITGTYQFLVNQRSSRISWKNLAGIPLGAFALGRLGDIFTMRVAVYADAVVFVLLIALLIGRGWLADLNVSKIDDVTSSSPAAEPIASDPL